MCAANEIGLHDVGSAHVLQEMKERLSEVRVSRHMTNDMDIEDAEDET